MARVERTVVEAARLVEDARTFARIAPELAIGRARPAPAIDDAAEGPGLARDGFARLGPIVTEARAATMARALAALVREGIPTTFAYVWDAFWDPAADVLAWAARTCGAYELTDDTWAFYVEPGARGWAPHRGSEALAASRRAPDLLNVWIALSDVREDGGAMHLVPLDEDPAYPSDLADVSSGVSRGRAIATAAGEALSWDANLLHWGGRCAEGRSARASLTYTLRRRGARIAEDARAVDPASMSFTARLDVVACQLLRYEESAGGVDPAFRAWAEAVSGVALLRRLVTKP